jgi:hypothetical protein
LVQVLGHAHNALVGERVAATLQGDKVWFSTQPSTFMQFGASMGAVRTSILNDACPRKPH